MQTQTSVKRTIKEWRLRKGVKQHEMAEKLGIFRDTYRTWERDITNIKVKQLFEVCKILEIQLQDIDFQEQTSN